MTGDVEAEQFLFRGEQVALRPFGQAIDSLAIVPGLFLHGSEERSLATLAVLNDTGGASQSAFDLRKQSRARLAEGIARAGADQRFEHFFIYCARIHPLA